MEGSIKGTVTPGRLTTHQGPISKNKATIQARFDGEIQEKKDRKNLQVYLTWMVVRAAGGVGGYVQNMCVKFATM